MVTPYLNVENLAIDKSLKDFWNTWIFNIFNYTILIMNQILTKSFFSFY